jgi:biopolymer transport protein ExbD
MGMDVGSNRGAIRSDINITPLVDVVLVLLIIFMVLTPLMEKELLTRVPEEPDPKQLVEPPDPNDPPPMVFKVDAEGKFTVNGAAIPGDAALGIPELNKYYKIAKSNEASNPKAGPPIMFFEADDKAKYAACVQGLDMIRQSAPSYTGWTIGMMTEKMAPNPTPGAEGQPAPEPK